jgi:hypothetical protein
MSALDAKLQIRPGQKIALVGPGPDLALAAERADASAADAVLVLARNQAELAASARTGRRRRPGRNRLARLPESPPARH